MNFIPLKFGHLWSHEMGSVERMVAPWDVEGGATHPDLPVGWEGGSRHSRMAFRRLRVALSANWPNILFIIMCEYGRALPDAIREEHSLPGVGGSGIWCIRFGMQPYALKSGRSRLLWEGLRTAVSLNAAAGIGSRKGQIKCPLFR